MPRSGAFPHFCSEAPAIGAGNPLLQQRRRRLAERSQTERRQQPEDLRRPPPPQRPGRGMRRGALRGSGSRGERSRRLCARSAALCAGRGGAAGQTKAQSRSAGSQRVTRGRRHRRAPRPKPRCVAGGRGSGPYSPGAAERSPKAAESSQPGRAAVPGSSAPAAGRHEPGTPLPEPLTVPRGPLLLPGFDIFRRSACLRRARPCAAPRLRAPRRRLPPPAGAMRSLLPSEAASRPQQGALSEPARVVAPLLGHALPWRRRAGRPRSPRRAPPTARDGAGRPAIPTHAPAGSRRTSLPRWRPPESAAAAARGCCCRRTGSWSHGTDRRRRRRRARGNPTSCCRRRPPRCRTSRRASAVAEGYPRPDPRSRRAAARRSAPPWRAPGGTAREERPQPLSAHLRRPRPVLWERPPPRPALLRAAPRRGRHSVAMAVPRRAPGRRRWTRNPRAVGGSAGAPVGRAGSC